MADPKLIQEWLQKADEDLGFAASIVDPLDAGVQIIEPLLYRHAVPGPLAYGLYEGQGLPGTGCRRGNSRDRQGLSGVITLPISTLLMILSFPALSQLKCLKCVLHKI